MTGGAYLARGFKASGLQYARVIALPVTVYAIVGAFKQAVMALKCPCQFYPARAIVLVACVCVCVCALKSHLENLVLAYLAHTGYMKLL